MSTLCKDDPALAPWFRVPDPSEPECFGVGDMWEQTAMQRLQGGLIVGSVAQKVDLSVTVAGHFVLRAEKVAAEVMRCSVIPVRFKRLRAESGNLAESVALLRDETHGNSVTFQFRLDHAHGRQAYLALIAGELPPLVHVSPEGTSAPVALVGRESVNAKTVRWQMQLLRQNFALGASREVATHVSSDASGQQSLLRTGKEKTQVSWHGSSKRSWEVFALYNHLADAHGAERRVFREMLLYLNYALQPAEKDLLRRHDGAALAQSRQKQLVELARSLNTGLPALSRPQAEGHFAVEVFVALNGGHINLLANKSAHEVADAAWRSHVDERRARAVTETFAEMRAIETEQRAMERQACSDARAAGHAPSPVDNALLRAAFDQFELDATTRQAQLLAKLLADGDALSLVTYILQQPAVGAATAVAPLTMSCSVDCSAYEAADDFARDVPELEEAIAAELATTTDGRRRLRAALVRIGEGIPLLRAALQTAAGDALSAAWEGPSWAARRARWQEALGDVRQLGSAEALTLRADAGEALLLHEELFAVATNAERVDLLRRRWHALQATQPKALDTVAHLLDDCLEELHKELKACRDALGSGEEADAITGWVGIGLVALVHAVEQDAPISSHPRIRRQLRQMHEFLAAGALAQFGATTGTLPLRQPLAASELRLAPA